MSYCGLSVCTRAILSNTTIDTIIILFVYGIPHFTSIWVRMNKIEISYHIREFMGR